MYPINKTPIKERRKHVPISKFQNYDTTHQTHIKNIYMGKSSYLKSNLHSVPLSKEDEYIYTRFWRAVNKLEPFRKRILYLKYDYNFDVINSNKKIAGLCGCSEETVRKYVNKVIVNFTQTPLIR